MHIISCAELHGLLACVHSSPLQQSLHLEALVQLYATGVDEQPLCEVIGALMRRSTKASVEHEIDIPPMRERRVWLHHSAVEREHMRRLQIVVKSRLPRAMLHLFDDADRADGELHNLNRTAIDGVFAHLLQLRKACVHPALVNVGRAAAPHRCVQRVSPSRSIAS